MGLIVGILLFVLGIMLLGSMIFMLQRYEPKGSAWQDDPIIRSGVVGFVDAFFHAKWWQISRNRRVRPGGFGFVVF